MRRLDGRLDALEQLAERVRRRAYRKLVEWMAARERLTATETEEAYAEALGCLAMLDQWRREGLTDREMLERYAEREGQTMAAMDALLEEAKAYFDDAA